MDFLAGLAIPEQALWVACFLFYIVDNIKFLPDKEVLIVRGFSGRWAPIFPNHSFHAFGRVPTIANLFTPWATVARITWLTADPFNQRALHFTRKRLRLRCGRTQAYRVLSVLVFILFFLFAPLLTHLFGLSQAIRFVLPWHVGALTCLAMLLVFERQEAVHGFAGGAALVLECAISPGAFADVARRLGVKAGAISGDGVALAIADSGDGESEFRRRLEFQVEDLRERGLLGSEGEKAIALYYAELSRRETINDCA